MTGYTTMAREEFWDYAQRARTAGKDLAEVLDRAGVLLTPERKAAVEHELLEALLMQLNRSEAHQWIEPGLPVTATDLKNSIVRWLADMSGKALVKSHGGR